jgi:hypothetical protein
LIASLGRFGVEVLCLSNIRVMGQDTGHCYSGVFWMLIPIMNFSFFPRLRLAFAVKVADLQAIACRLEMVSVIGDH